ncbi:hypothetical protein Golomagni_06020 [Golovinomyces magnicellulatus]|nr:hypothetical protein Golomagni_06020 [Golovinomyces magnicellulatus]
MDWQQAVAICVRIASVASRAVSILLQTIILFLLLAAAYRLTLHPLAKIPGPRLAAVSGVWYAYHARNGLVAKLGRRLHKQYGPVVRVAPNEVWCSSKESFESIYDTEGKTLTLLGTGSKGLEKSDFYLALSLTKPEIDIKLQPKFPDTLDLLSDRNMKRYRLQRRLIGPVYRKESVIKFEEAVDKVLEAAVKRIRNLDSESVDLKQWMHIITVECLGASVLSWSPGMLQAGTDWNSSKHSYLGWRRKSVFGIFPGITRLEMYSKSAGRIFATLWNVKFQLPPGFKTFFPLIGCVEKGQSTDKVCRKAKCIEPPSSRFDDGFDPTSP